MTRSDLTYDSLIYNPLVMKQNNSFVGLHKVKTLNKVDVVVHYNYSMTNETD